MVLFSVSNKLCDYFMMTNSPKLHFIDIMVIFWYILAQHMVIWPPGVTLFIIISSGLAIIFPRNVIFLCFKCVLWSNCIVRMSKFTIYWNNLDISAHFWSKFWHLTPRGISLYGYTLQICPLCLINVIVLCLK